SSPNSSDTIKKRNPTPQIARKTPKALSGMELRFMANPGSVLTLGNARPKVKYGDSRIGVRGVAGSRGRGVAGWRGRWPKVLHDGQPTTGRETNLSELVGFIGLGVMGRPMARNLLRRGHRLIVHSRSSGPVDELGPARADRGA